MILADPLFDINAIIDEFSNPKKGEKLSDDDIKKNLQNDETSLRIKIVTESFNLWKDSEIKRQKRKTFLLWVFGGLCVIQVLFILTITCLSAYSKSFHLSDPIFISAVAGSLAEVIGIITVITKNIFDDKSDKIIKFITSWQEKHNL